MVRAESDEAAEEVPAVRKLLDPKCRLEQGGEGIMLKTKGAPLFKVRVSCVQRPTQGNVGGAALYVSGQPASATLRRVNFTNNVASGAVSP